MKTRTIGSFFVLFAIASGIATTLPDAFADHPEVTITTALNSSFPGCEQTDECYTPSTATVDVGGTVTMTNIDTIHTFTSGTVENSKPIPDDIFDSGFLNVDESFEWIPQETGEYPYYCLLHTWMQGTIIVQESDGESRDDDHGDGDHGDGDHSDVELMVSLTDIAVLGGTQVELEFNEPHVNYEIIAMQDGVEIFRQTGHAMESAMTHQIDAVGSDENPIDVEIVSLGVGLPDNESEWTGPKGETVAEARIVPEFGTIAIMILFVAVISIIAVTTKSRVVPRF